MHTSSDHFGPPKYRGSGHSKRRRFASSPCEEVGEVRSNVCTPPRIISVRQSIGGQGTVVRLISARQGIGVRKLGFGAQSCVSFQRAKAWGFGSSGGSRSSGSAPPFNGQAWLTTGVPLCGRMDWLWQNGLRGRQSPQASAAGRAPRRNSDFV